MEQYFHDEWVRSLFGHAVDKLKEECERRGKDVPFRLFVRYELEAIPKRSHALGAILYFLLTARPPFEVEAAALRAHGGARALPIAPRRWVPDIPHPIEAVVIKAMSVLPMDRYGSAEELAAETVRFFGFAVWIGMYYAVLPIVGLSSMQNDAPGVRAIVFHLFFSAAMTGAYVLYPRLFGKHRESHAHLGRSAQAV